MDYGKVPPHDIEAEQAVIGSMLLEKDAVISAIEKLKPEDFYREDNKQIFQAMFNLYSKDIPIDVVTVKSELVELGTFERVGGFEYVAELPDKVPTTSNVDRYIKIVQEKSMMRRLISMSNELISLGYDETEDVDNILDIAEKRIFALSQNKSEQSYFAMKDILYKSLEELEKLSRLNGSVTGLSTGFHELDLMTSGLHGSELIIVAARPAMGKSAFAINIATNSVMKNKKGAVIFNLEMSKEQVANRILCSEALVDSNKLRTGKLESEDWVKIASTVSTLSEAEIYIDDTPGITAMEIRAKCRKLKMEKDIGLVVIDYLQLISGSGKRGQSREQEISEISRALKILAKELDIPVIALSQLARSAEKRDDKRPMLSDLRESGAIEQDADIVTFLYRDDYYNPDSEEKNVAEVIIAKQRGGSTGTVKLAWLPEFTKFGDLDRRYGEEF